MGQMARIGLRPLETVEMGTTSQCMHSTGSNTSCSIYLMNSFVSGSRSTLSSIIMAGSDFVAGNERSSAIGCILLSKSCFCPFVAMAIRNNDANPSSGGVDIAANAVCNSLVNHFGGHMVWMDHILVGCNESCTGFGTEDGFLTWLAVIDELPDCCGGHPREPESCVCACTCLSMSEYMFVHE